jgi:hypothetical protein
MLPEGGDIKISDSVKLDTVHRLDGAHEGHLIEEACEQASQQGDESVAGSSRGDGWPEAPSGSLSVIMRT